MKRKVRKGCGGIVANAIRQIALTELNCLRPIAVKVGNDSNVISAGPHVLEDMIQVCSNLNALGYVCNNEKEVIEFRTVVTGTLMASELKSDEFSVVLPNGQDLELMHVLNDSIELIVYFKNSHGVCGKDDNVYSLTQAGYDTDKLVVINSRHTDVENFSYVISDDTDVDTDSIDFSISSRISDKLDFEEKVLEDSIQILEEILKNL